MRRSSLEYGTDRALDDPRKHRKARSSPSSGLFSTIENDSIREEGILLIMKRCNPAFNVAVKAHVKTAREKTR